MTGAESSGTCKVCGCTDLDCRVCIQKTGSPCSWADRAHTICSRHTNHLVVAKFLATGVEQ